MSRVESPAQAVDRPRGRPVTRMGGHRLWEPLALAGVVLVALVVRRPNYMLSHPFWLDEGWVANSVQAPLEQVPLLTSSTPIGWTLLLRVVPPVGGPQYLRLLPLTFAVASVLPAWWLGRRVGEALGRAAPAYAVAAGLAAALVPTGLARHDLKQYTADACLTLLLVGVAAHLNADWLRADGAVVPLVILAAACILAFPLSNAAPFVAFGLFGGLAAATTARRAWRRLVTVAAAAATVGLAQGAFYAAFMSAGDNAVIRDYWAHAYIPTDQGFGAAVEFTADRFRQALDSLGLGPWPVTGALVGLGLVALAQAGLGWVALAPPLVAAGLVAAAALHRYPLLDQRTSLFVTTLWMVLAALGLVWLVVQLARSRPSTVLSAALVIAVAAALLPADRRATARPLPAEDVGTAVKYILDRRRPGDAVIVSHLDAYPFAWYWPDQPSFAPTLAPTAVRFQVEYPPGGVIVARRSDAGAVEDALGQVQPGTRRIWLVVDHATVGQRARWLSRLAGLGAASRAPVDGLVLAEIPASRS